MLKSQNYGIWVFFIEGVEIYISIEITTTQLQQEGIEFTGLKSLL